MISMQGLLEAINNLRKRVCQMFSNSRSLFNMLQGLKMRCCLPKNLPNIVPQFLPTSVVYFLASSCALSEKEVEECWTVVEELLFSS